MPRSLLGELFRYLRRESASAGQEFSDGALLRRFLDQRDEAAFENLVQRHGPMVLGVCQRVVGDTHAAEDAFQATFFVLARKAGSIRNQASVGSWLFGVAQRIASKARAQAATRRDRERRAADMPRIDKLDELTWHELRSILDEEIGRLPTKYQAAVVLCHLEGKSYDQAAQELGCPKSTLATRLAKALELLRDQLTRRGLALSAGALATALTEEATAAPVAALLSINIMKAAASVAAGKPLAAGILSTPAIALAEEAMKTMIGIKMKLVALVLALSLAVGVGYAGYSALLEQPPPKVDEKQPPVVQEQPAKKEPAGPAKKLPTAWLNVGAANFAAFLPDGKQVVTAGPDGNIHVWEFPAGKEIRRIAMPEGSVKGMLALSPDGKTIAVAKFDETEIYLYDLATGKQRSVLKWAAPQAKAPWNVHSSLAFSPSGEHLAAQDRDAVVSIWDWANGKEIRKFGSGNGRGQGLAYAPDGKSILTIDRDNQSGIVKQPRLKTWDPATGKELRTIRSSGSTSMLTAISFSPDSKSLAIGDVTGIVIVDTATGQNIRRLTKQQQTSFTNGGLVFSKDGAKLYYRFNDKIVEYEVARGKVIRLHELHALDFSLSPDGTTLLAAGSRLRFFDLSGKEFASLLDDADAASTEAHDYAVNLVRSYGGNVLRDDTQPGKPVIGVSFSSAKQKPFGFTLSSPSDVLKELKHFKQLTSLDLSNSPMVGDRHLSELKALKQLTTLHLGGTAVTGAGLSELKELKQLTTLDLSSALVTDAGLKDLKELKQLTKLNLGRTQVTDAGLKELKELKQLKELNLGNTKVPIQGKTFKKVKELEGTTVTNAGLMELKELKQLATLDLSFTHVTDVGLMELKELKHLTKLNLNGTMVSDEGLKAMKELLAQLRELNLGNTHVTDAGLKVMKELKELTKLNLDGTKIKDVGLKELKELKQIQELYLRSCSNVTAAGVKELQEALPKCKIINDNSNPPQKSGEVRGNEADPVKLVKNLGGRLTRDDTQPGKPVIGIDLSRNTQVTDADLKRLKEFKQLTTLDLKGTHVTDAWLKELKELKQLKTLYIGGDRSQVTNEGLKELKELKQLRTLGLGYTKVTDTGLKELRELQQLTRLILLQTKVTDAGVKELQKALPKCKISR